MAENQEDNKPREVLDFRGPNAAKELLATLEKEKAGQKSHAQVKDDTDWQYVQWCRHGHVAFFYVDNPSKKTCTPKDWYATYKRQDEPWNGPALCQECSQAEKDGTINQNGEVPVQVTYTVMNRRTTEFTTNPYYLYRFPKNAQKRKEIPPHRYEQVEVSAANVGVPNPDFPERVRNPRKERTVTVHEQ